MKLSNEQIRALAHDLAAQALTRMGDPEPERQQALRQALKAWLPTADEFELRTVAPLIADCFNGFAILLDQRKERLVASGRAEPYT